MTFPFGGNALVALLAAAAWGAGDFSGGMGVKVSGGGTASSLRIIAVGHAASLAVLLVLYGVGSTPWPHGRPAVWGLLAGVVAGLSITAFYVALARGSMGVSAAVSGLLAAAIPAAASSLLEGRPTLVQAAGFALAAAAIWLVAAGPHAESETPGDAERGHLPATGMKRSITLLAILGGVGFGVYFFLLRLANPLGLLAPVTLARVGSLSTSLLLLAVLGSSRRLEAEAASSSREPSRSRPFFGLSAQALGWALGVALMDTAGNLFFVASTRLGRLDVASLLASLYPAGTILLAALYLHERPTRQQLTGIGLALVAVVLVTV